MKRKIKIIKKIKNRENQSPKKIQIIEKNGKNVNKTNRKTEE